jgi:hypothetical protein
MGVVAAAVGHERSGRGKRSLDEEFESEGLLRPCGKREDGEEGRRRQGGDASPKSRHEFLSETAATAEAVVFRAFSRI